MRIGILGAGQLGRMLALAGYPLGLRFRFFDPAAECAVDDLAPRVRADYGDFAALQTFAKGIDVITYEFENVPVEAVEFLEQFAPVHPNPRALATAQDRLAEKELFCSLRIGTPKFALVDGLQGVKSAIESVGFPAILKTRRMGYDGKGQMAVSSQPELERAITFMDGTPCILEERISFRRELSVIAVRSLNGSLSIYPITENVHREGILRVSSAPVADLPSELVSEANRIASTLLTNLNIVGVSAIELFDTECGLLANEMAPRVHNSGHWTQDGAVTSQFENHLRAITGMPLGDSSARGWSGMVNFIGECPSREEVLTRPLARLHLYDKAPRSGRKVGHVNVVADSPESRDQWIRDIVGR